MYSLHTQDLFVLVICASTVYLLRARDTYEFVPAWRKDINMDSFANERYPGTVIIVSSKRCAVCVTN